MIQVNEHNVEQGDPVGSDFLIDIAPPRAGTIATQPTATAAGDARRRQYVRARCYRLVPCKSHALWCFSSFWEVASFCGSVASGAAGSCLGVASSVAGIVRTACTPVIHKLVTSTPAVLKGAHIVDAKAGWWAPPVADLLALGGESIDAVWQAGAKAVGTEEFSIALGERLTSGDLVKKAEFFGKGMMVLDIAGKAWKVVQSDDRPFEVCVQAALFGAMAGASIGATSLVAPSVAVATSMATGMAASGGLPVLCGAIVAVGVGVATEAVFAPKIEELLKRTYKENPGCVQAWGSVPLMRWHDVTSGPDSGADVDFHQLFWTQSVQCV